MMTPLERIWLPSPNFSSRHGASVRLIVLHTAEGARTFEDLGHFFQGNVQVSSHVGIDDTPNRIGEFVKPHGKAWHVAAFNPVAVGAEQCAFASWSRDEWMRHPNLLENTARWVAEEAARFGIPIVKLDASQAQGSGRGVCQHRDLGPAGGGHFDCGDGYPIDHVLELARGNGSPTPAPGPTPAPPPLPKETTMLQAYQTADRRVGFVVETYDGNVLHIEQQNPNDGSGKNTDFWRKPDGSPNWLPLGNPGK